MKNNSHRARVKSALYATIAFIFLSISGFLGNIGYQNVVAFADGSAGSAVTQSTAPAPLLEQGHQVDWWFVFKFNASSFPGCGNGAQRNCLFGGKVQDYQGGYGQQFVYASSENTSLQKGSGCAGDALQDPIGATFDQVYNDSYYYVISPIPGKNTIRTPCSKTTGNTS